MTTYAQRAKELHSWLQTQGVRVFDIAIDGEVETVIHLNKKVSEWRDDVRAVISEANATCDSKDGMLVDDLRNKVRSLLRGRGYVEIHDVVADVFEGRIAVQDAIIVDDPSHDVQENGFGHYGHEATAMVE